MNMSTAQSAVSEYAQRVDTWLAAHRINVSIVSTGYRQGFSDDDTGEKSRKLWHDTYHATFTRQVNDREERFDVASFKQSSAHSRSYLEHNGGCTCPRRFGERMTHTAACPANTANFSTPSAYDVLACVAKSNPGTFREFCSEFGYAEDSMSAHRTYLAVQDEYAAARKFFTADELNELMEIAS